MTKKVFFDKICTRGHQPEPLQDSGEEEEELVLGKTLEQNKILSFPALGLSLNSLVKLGFSSDGPEQTERQSSCSNFE
jgi:hypothetical protein